MKSCPTCNRTFPDTLSFCLVDGAILSAPFDTQVDPPPSAKRSEQPRSGTIKGSPPAPTVSMQSEETGELPPTIASPFPPSPKVSLGARHAAARPAASGIAHSRRFIWAAAVVLTLIVVAFVGWRYYRATKPALTSPTATTTALLDSCKRSDIPAMRATLSTSYLKFVDGYAERKQTSADAFLTKLASDLNSEYGGHFEVRNELISGDKASLEISRGEDWRTWTFEKENGEWKFSP